MRRPPEPEREVVDVTSVRVSIDGLMVRRAAHPPMSLPWKALAGVERHTHSATLTLKDGPPLSLPADLEGLDELLANIETEITQHAETAARHVPRVLREADIARLLDIQPGGKLVCLMEREVPKGAEPNDDEPPLRRHRTALRELREAAWEALAGGPRRWWRLFDALVFEDASAPELARFQTGLVAWSAPHATADVHGVRVHIGGDERDIPWHEVHGIVEVTAGWRVMTTWGRFWISRLAENGEALAAGIEAIVGAREAED